MKRNRTYSLNFVPPRASGSSGWVVVLGVSLVFIFSTSLTTIFDIIFSPVSLSTDNSSITLATNIFIVLSNLTILATGFLIKDLSAKHFVIIGTSLLFIGLALSVFVSSLIHLIITYSIICGVGIGLLNPASFVAVLSCFSTSRNHAIGVTFAALGLGQLVMPLLVEVIEQHFSLRVAIGIICAMSALGIVGANLLAPIKWRQVEQHRNSISFSDEEQQPLLQPVEICEKHSMVHEVARTTDLDLLLDYSFLIISIGLALIYAISVDFSNILPAFLSEQYGLEIQIATKYPLIISAADIISRIIFPFIQTALNASSINVFIIGVAGITTVKILLLSFNLPYAILIILSVIHGIFKALTVVNQVLIVADFCKNFCPRKLPGMLGLSFVIKSILLYTLVHFFNTITFISLNTSTRVYSHIILQSFVIIIWIVAL